jgi:hypothetical protein
VKATIQKQTRENEVTAVTLEHTVSGYQIRITAAKEGFIIHSSEGLQFRLYSDFAYLVLPNRRKKDERS